MFPVRADAFDVLLSQCLLQLELSSEATAPSTLHSHILCHQPPVVKHFSPFRLLTLLVSILIQTLLNTAETPGQEKMGGAGAWGREKKV